MQRQAPQPPIDPDLACWLGLVAWPCGLGADRRASAARRRRAATSKETLPVPRHITNSPPGTNSRRATTPTGSTAPAAPTPAPTPGGRDPVRRLLGHGGLDRDLGTMTLWRGPGWRGPGHAGGLRAPGGHSEDINTRSHPELGRENPQRRWYCVSRRGRAGRRQALAAPTPRHLTPGLDPGPAPRGWSSPVAVRLITGERLGERREPLVKAHPD